jgi:hypothetical protein
VSHGPLVRGTARAALAIALAAALPLAGLIPEAARAQSAPHAGPAAAPGATAAAPAASAPTEASAPAAAPTSAVAEPLPPASAPAPLVASDAAPGARLPMLGVMLDAGLPDGAVVSGVYRPWPFARFDAGLGYNLIGFGLRAGATAAPWRLAVTPILRAELGHTFESDAASFVGNFATLDTTEKLVLSKVGYTYASLQLGAEFGAPDRAIFFVRGGLSWYWATANGYPDAARSQGATATDGASVSGRVPTLNLGVLFYVW